jgi:hypothetical protein
MGAGWQQTLTNYSMLQSVSHMDLISAKTYEGQRSVLIEYEAMCKKVKLYDEANVKHTDETCFFQRHCLHLTHANECWCAKRTEKIPRQP